MEQNETGCQAPPEAPILCANNCGFFGSTATMNLCSKCHKDMILKEEQAKLAANSIRSIVNGSSSKDSEAATSLHQREGSSTHMVLSVQSTPSLLNVNTEKPKEGPKRCTTCKKRVGLTGFNCRCGNLFCAAHRYSDKHDCPFDYRGAAQDAIARANPVVKAEKLDKI